MFIRPVAPHAPVFVHRPPQAGEQVKAVVKAAVSGPVLRDLEGPRCVPVVPELGEVVSADCVPVAVSVSPSQILRHVRQILQIQWRAFKQPLVVLDRRKDERVVLRVLVPFGIVRVSVIVPVDKQPLDPRMSHAAGVARQIHPFRVRRRTAKAAAQEVKRTLCELRRLVNEDPVVLQTVVFVFAFVALPVTELDRRTVLKSHQVA